MRKSMILFVFLIGCGGSSDASGLFGTGGSGVSSSTTGETNQTTASSSNSTSASSGQGSGGGNQTTGQGGSGGMIDPCHSAQACNGVACGEMVDDCGKAVMCPDQCSAPLTCGGTGNPNQCGCKSKTCLDQGFDCGIADDGCGGKIDCGTCVNEYFICGGNNIDMNGAPIPGSPNKCGGGCITRDVQCDKPNKPISYYCEYPGVNPPYNGTNCVGENSNPPNEIWCCES